jgi:hypothetical protein
METKIAFRLDKDAVEMLASRRTPGLHGLSLSQVARSILMTVVTPVVTPVVEASDSSGARDENQVAGRHSSDPSEHIEVVAGGG